MIDYIRAELYKTLRLRTFRVISIIVILQALICTAADFYIAKEYVKENEGLDNIIQGINTINSLTGTIMILVIIFAASVFTSDYTTGTVKQYMSRGLSRTCIYFSRVIVIVITTLIIQVTRALLEIIPVTVKFGFGSIDMNMATYLIRVVIAVVLYTIFYVGITILAATVTKSVSAAMGSSIILMMMMELVLKGVDYILHKNLSKYWIDNIISRFIDPISYSTMEYLRCSVALAVFIVGVVAAGCFAYNKQEV